MVAVCVRNHTVQVHIEAIREKEEKTTRNLPCNTKVDTKKENPSKKENHHSIPNPRKQKEIESSEAATKKKKIPAPAHAND